MLKTNYLVGSEDLDKYTGLLSFLILILSKLFQICLLMTIKDKKIY